MKTTGSQVEVTVTVRVKGFPMQVPVLGVTVYMAVPWPEGIERVPVMDDTGVDCEVPPVTPPV